MTRAFHEIPVAPNEELEPMPMAYLSSFDMQHDRLSNAPDLESLLDFKQSVEARFPETAKADGADKHYGDVTENLKLKADLDYWKHDDKSLEASANIAAATSPEDLQGGAQLLYEQTKRLRGDAVSDAEILASMKQSAAQLNALHLQIRYYETTGQIKSADEIMALAHVYQQQPTKEIKVIGQKLKQAADKKPIETDQEAHKPEKTQDADAEEVVEIKDKPKLTLVHSADKAEPVKEGNTDRRKGAAEHTANRGSGEEQAERRKREIAYIKAHRSMLKGHVNFDKRGRVLREDGKQMSRAEVLDKIYERIAVEEAAELEAEAGANEQTARILPFPNRYAPEAVTDEAEQQPVPGTALELYRQPEPVYDQAVRIDGRIVAGEVDAEIVDDSANESDVTADESKRDDKSGQPNSQDEHVIRLGARPNLVADPDVQRMTYKPGVENLALNNILVRKVGKDKLPKIKPNFEWIARQALLQTGVVGGEGVATSAAAKDEALKLNREAIQAKYLQIDDAGKAVYGEDNPNAKDIRQSRAYKIMLRAVTLKEQAVTRVKEYFGNEEKGTRRKVGAALALGAVTVGAVWLARQGHDHATVTDSIQPPAKTPEPAIVPVVPPEVHHSLTISAQGNRTLSHIALQHLKDTGQIINKDTIEQEWHRLQVLNNLSDRQLLELHDGQQILVD